MASFNIHLAIGIKYINNNNIFNRNEFLRGIIDPDLDNDKNISHYRMKEKNDTLLEHLRCKVNLVEFLNTNDLSSDYKKGIFLHLVTDYLFFNYFFDKFYISNISYQDFVNDLYYTYDVFNDYLDNLYGIDKYLKTENLNEYIKKAKETNKYFKGEYKLIFDENTISNFIDKVSSINLEEYKDKILSNNSNVLP